jgi:2'-5' RNA ligase
MTNVTTTQTALCLIPPENVWEQIQSIRSIHDKAYPRWMPHINLIYPFTPEENFHNIKSNLESILNRKKPFQIQFDQSSLDYFKQRGDECTYHLRPKNSTEIVELQKLIHNQLSNLIRNKRTFQAHLTLGQTTTSKISDVLMDIKAKWKTIEFTVDRVFMISRENHPENLFTIKNEILLLDQEEESLPLAISNLTITSVKSIAINYLCIILPNRFSSNFLHLSEKTSFRAAIPFRIILAECENGPSNFDLRSKLESTPKFTLDFGRDSLNFDETTSRLFLKLTNMETIHQLNVLDTSKYDGTLTLGELQKNDFDKVSDRFMKTWTADTNQFEIDRVHLVDTNGRFKFIFRLKNPCLS